MCQVRLYHVHMPLNVLDKEGLPPAGIERKLAHHILGRQNTIAKRVVYGLLGGPRRNGELLPYAGKSPNNLTQVLKLLRAEGVIVDVADTRATPPQVAYKLTTLGLLVVDWMRRYEFLDDVSAHRSPIALSKDEVERKLHAKAGRRVRASVESTEDERNDLTSLVGFASKRPYETRKILEREFGR